MAQTTKEETEPQMKATVFWNVTLCSMAGMYVRFERNCLHLQSTKQDTQDTLLTCTVLVTFQAIK